MGRRRWAGGAGLLGGSFLRRLGLLFPLTANADDFRRRWLLGQLLEKVFALDVGAVVRVTLVLAAQLDLGLGERRRGGGGVIFSDTERGLFTLTLSERGRGGGGVIFTDTERGLFTLTLSERGRAVSYTHLTLPTKIGV